MVGNHVFTPVISDSRNRWNHTPFNLKFDAKWTNQAGSIVQMDSSDMISVSVTSRQGAINGMRFSTGSEWIASASGKNLKISLTTKVMRRPCAYRTAYIPQDLAHSGFYLAQANVKPSTFSFDFKLPEGSGARTHFVIFEPQENDTIIQIINAQIEVQ